MSLVVVNYLSIKLDEMVYRIFKEVGSNDFYERALRKSENCHILVTNHAMVMTDQERELPILLAWLCNDCR